MKRINQIKKQILRMVMCLLLAFSFGLLSSMPAFATDTAEHSCGLPVADCIVCTIADKINSLPDAEAITADNAAEVTDRIHAIDRLKAELDEQAYNELMTLVERGNDGTGVGVDVPLRYMNAVDAIRKFGHNLSIRKTWITADGTKLNVENSVVQFKVTNTGTGASVVLTMATMPYNSNFLSASPDFYSANEAGDGWTYKYTLPAGTYTIEEISDNGAVSEDGSHYSTAYTTCTYNGVEEETNCATVTIGDGETAELLLSNVLQKVVNIVAEDAATDKRLSGVDIQVTCDDTTVDEQYRNQNITIDENGGEALQLLGKGNIQSLLPMLLMAISFLLKCM